MRDGEYPGLGAARLDHATATESGEPHDVTACSAVPPLTGRRAIIRTGTTAMTHHNALPEPFTVVTCLGLIAGLTSAVLGLNGCQTADNPRGDRDHDGCSPLAEELTGRCPGRPEAAKRGHGIEGE
jgi:hypothetical protein